MTEVQPNQQREKSKEGLTKRILDAIFVPTSFVRFVARTNHFLEEEGDKLGWKTKVSGYFSSSVLELARLMVYYQIAEEVYKRINS